MIKKLRNLGYDGPHSGAKHPFMRQGSFTLTIPNKHKSDEVPVWLLKDILEEAGISEQDWLNA